MVATCFMQQLITFWSILDQFITFHLQQRNYLLLDFKPVSSYLLSYRVQLISFHYDNKES